MKTDVVVLAAGKGSRMKSQLAKVLHPLAGTPLLGHVLQTIQSIGNAHVVIGHQANAVMRYAHPYGVKFAFQEQQLGTGHAVQCIIDQISSEKTLVLLGDVPLLKENTLRHFIDSSDSNLALLTLKTANPDGYGRIVRSTNGSIEAIVEHKECTPAQRTIDEVNTGIMLFDTQKLKEWLPRLKNQNKSGEYYLTDLIAIARSEGESISSHTTMNEFEVMGVNTPEQLAQLEALFVKQQVG